MTVQPDPSARSRVNVVSLVMALAFLMIASAGFTGSVFWIFTAATKWIVAGVAALIGVIMLMSALPGLRRTGS